MRIAIYHNLPSGGAKRTLCDVTTRLALRHRVDTYTLSCSEHQFADLRPSVADYRMFPFDPLPLLKSPFGRFNQVLRCVDLQRLNRLARQIARHIDEGDYDVAFVQPCKFEHSPSVLRYLQRTRSVYYCHEPPRFLYEPMPARPYDDAFIGRRRLLNRLDPLPRLHERRVRDVDQQNTRNAGAVLVNSRFTAQAVARIYGVDAHVSYHGVDVERFRPMPVTKRDVVLSVGSLTPLKGFDFLIEAMAHYPCGNRPVLVIASNFQNVPERDYLARLARRRQVRLVLVGTVSDEDLVRLYNEARVVVYAPVREPFGLVPLEAMACATPVVAVAEGGVLESVVDGQTGFLTNRDPVRFAAAVQRLVDDPTLACRCGLSGRAHVLRYWTWDRAITWLEKYLEGSSWQASAVPGKPPSSLPRNANGVAANRL